MFRRRGAAAAVAVVMAVVAVPAARALPTGSLKRTVSQQTVKDFAAHFKATLTPALRPLVEKTRSLAPRSGRTRLVDVSVNTAGGSLDAEGWGLILPKPPRFEVSLLFKKVREEETRTPLILNGIVQFNYIAVGRGKANGLFKGQLDLGGSYSGTVDVHGEVSGSRVISLVVTKGRNDYRVGGKPSPFVSYTSTLAGNGSSGTTNGTGSSARFNRPEGVSVDEDGNVFVADSYNNMVRKVTPRGAVTTVVDELDDPRDVAVDANGDLIVSNGSDAALVRLVNARGEPIPIVFHPKSEERPSPFEYCYDLVYGSCDGRSPMGTMDAAQGIDVHGGVTYVAQSGQPAAIRMVMPDGMIMTAHNSAAGGRQGGDCGHAGILGGNRDVAKGNDGEIYYTITTTGCYGVLVLRSDGTVATLAGNLDQEGFTDGTGSNARFFDIAGIEFDGSRYLYTSESTNGLIRRIDVATGNVTRIAGCHPTAKAFSCDGLDYLSDGSRNKAHFYVPEHIDLDEWGDVYVADSGNHAIRVVHMVEDPQREPAINRFAPFAIEAGSTSVVEVKGVNLALTETASLGEGVTVDVTRAGSRTLFLTVTVAADAAPGPRTLTLTTPYGNAESPPGLGLQILEPGVAGATVETIAGTGSWAPGITDGPAELSQIAFPAGLATVGEHRVLVADPLEQRIRLIATKKGAADELVELLLYSSGASSALGSVFASMGAIGQILDGLGVAGMLEDAAEDTLRPIAEQAIDEMCDAADSDCEWISMPWAGTPMQRGHSNGFRLEAKLSFPSDIANAGGGTFYIADSGNQRVRVVGLNISEADPQPDPFVMHSAHALQDGRPFAIGEYDDNAALAGITAAAQIKRVLMQNGGTATEFAGVEGPRCVSMPGEENAKPLGFPMGIDSTSELVVVADPFCQTIWRFDKESGEVEDIRGSILGGRVGLDNCSDGPMSFAGFGAPVDVAIDKDGNIWFADAVCNSIRMIKDMNLTEQKIKDTVSGWYDAVGDQLPDATSDKIKELIDGADLSFLGLNDWWVFTVAGSQDGDAGFVDGPAEDARFATPTALATMTRDGKTVVVVSDAGNHRVRMITLP